MTSDSIIAAPEGPVCETVAGTRVYRFAVTDSTNDAAFRLAAGAEDEIFWVTAERQTAARGRRGRSWRGADGNLAASCLLTLPLRAEVDWLPFAAGLALHDAIARCVPGAGERIRLKWPNDLLIDHAKISGILLEARADETCRRIVLGFGVNVVAAPAIEDVERPATSLAAAALGTTSEAVLPVLIEQLALRARQVLYGDTELLRSDWLARATGLGEPITVRLPHETLYGRFAAVAADGRLVLATANGETINISAGDVFFDAAPRTSGIS